MAPRNHRDKPWFAWSALAYLAVTLLLGGASAGGDLAHLTLQILGALLLGWRLSLGPVRLSRPMWWLGASVAVLGLVQFVPLPPALWSLMQGRGPIAAGYHLAHIDLPWLFLSLSPWQSLAALASVIPSIAIFAAMSGSFAPARRQTIRVIVVVAAISVALGLLQWRLGQAYLYEITNYGRGPGFFSNSNHQSSFLLVALSLGCALPGRGKGHVWSLAIGAVVAGWFVLGLIINMSLACLTLLPMVLMALGLVLRPGWRKPLIMLPMLVLSVASVLGALWFPGSNDLLATGTIPGLSRGEFLGNGMHILRDMMPWGSGLGSFSEIYRWYENPQLATSTFVNHAHDDWLELLIETGILGLIVLVFFFRWLLERIYLLISRKERQAISSWLAVIAIVIELLQSLADYPLRTAALGALFSLCCAWLDEEPRDDAIKTDAPFPIA